MKRPETEALRIVTANLLAAERALSGMDPAARRATCEVLDRWLGILSACRAALGPVATQAEPRRRRPPVTAEAPAVPPAAHLTPGDNLLHCVAELVARRGPAPVTVADVRAHAARRGLLLPARPGNTFRFARWEGRPLFRCEDGAWRLTRAGEAYLRAVYRGRAARSRRRRDAA